MSKIKKMEKFDVDLLKKHPDNPKIHTDEQISAIAESISSFGFNQPIITDEENTILVGHGRLIAAKKLGLSKVPVWQLQGLNDDEKKLVLVNDNNLNQLTGFDETKLYDVLSSISVSEEEFAKYAVEFSPEEIKELDLEIPDIKEKKKAYDEAKIKHCLLYTSPSPRDATLSRMPSSA